MSGTKSLSNGDFGPKTPIPKRQLPEIPNLSQLYTDSTHFARDFVHKVETAIVEPLNELKHVTNERLSFEFSNGSTHFIFPKNAIKMNHLKLVHNDSNLPDYCDGRYRKECGVSSSSVKSNPKLIAPGKLDKHSNKNCDKLYTSQETKKYNKALDGKRIRCKSESINTIPVDNSINAKRPRELSPNLNKYQNVIDAFDDSVSGKMVTSIIEKLAVEEPKVYDLSRCAESLKAYSLKPCSVVLQDLEPRKALLQCNSDSDSPSSLVETSSSNKGSSQVPSIFSDKVCDNNNSPEQSLCSVGVPNEYEDSLDPFMPLTSIHSDAEIESDSPPCDESSESCDSDAMSGEEQLDPFLASVQNGLEPTTKDNCLIAIINNHTQSEVSPENCSSLALHSHKNDVSLGHEILPVWASHFSYIPPFINFTTQDVKVQELPELVRKHLKWRLSTITPILVRRTVTNVGFKLNRNSEAWIGTWGKHMLATCFKTLKETQKVNHIPGSFQIGRKDRLWKNFLSLQAKFGKKLFNYIPQTYVLPGDLKILKQDWEQCESRIKWIVKPPASARGQGIKVISQWYQIPKKKGMIVQKYISKPYLINGTKFDLRIYVIVTSVHPLRIYIYDDGLARFASVRYSSSARSLGDRFIHLTNYSINKNSSSYFHNNDVDACQGHKWTLKALWRYLDEQGVNTPLVWRKIKDIVVKTIISAESQMLSLSTEHVASNYTCYELFGFDIMLDERLKPWLLEVNISPSLHSSTPLDLAVKGLLIKDVLNLAMFHLPPGKAVRLHEREYLDQYGLSSRVQNLFHDKRIYSKLLGEEEMKKHNKFMSDGGNRKEYLHGILGDLTPDDIRILCRHEDELDRKGSFVRVFPTAFTHRYHKYFEAPRYYNYLIDAWENKYRNKRSEGRKLLESFCSKKMHLKVHSNRLISQSSLINDHSTKRCSTEVIFNVPQQEKIPNSEYTEERDSCCAAQMTNRSSYFGKQDEGMLEVIVGPSCHRYD